MTIRLIEQEMLSYLTTGSAQLSSLVSSKIYPMILPQNVSLPAITYQKIPGGRHTTYHGGHSGFVDGHYQFNCFHNLTNLGARQVADALISTLGHWTGTACIVNDDWDFYEADTQLFKTIVDVNLLGD